MPHAGGLRRAGERGWLKQGLEGAALLGWGFCNENLPGGNALPFGHTHSLHLPISRQTNSVATQSNNRSFHFRILSGYSEILAPGISERGGGMFGVSI